MIVGCSVTSIAWAVGSDALGLDAGLRFTFTYLLAGIPIGILAIGSVAPGILFLPIEAYRAATANEEEKRTRDLRVCKHEVRTLPPLLTTNPGPNPSDPDSDPNPDPNPNPNPALAPTQP